MYEEVTPVEETKIREGKCPDCGGQLLKGPRGGLSINVACSRCGSAFNVPGPFTPERIGKRPEAIRK